MTVSLRAQWPHSIEDIRKSLDGIWGLVGTTGVNGNLYRLERSLAEPVIYYVTEYNGADEADIKENNSFPLEEKEQAISFFARAIGFDI